MIYLTAKGLEKIHDAIIGAMGGESGVLDQSLLDGAALRPKTKIRGTEPFEDLVAKATALGFAINTWHPFFDGNKRTSLFAIYVMLALNDAEMAMPVYAVKYSVLLAKGELTEEQFQDQIANWSAKSPTMIFLKNLRYGWFPRFQMAFLSWLPYGLGWGRRSTRRLDWLAAGDAQVLQKTIQEYQTFTRQGFPKPVKLDLQYSDVLEE